VACCYLKRFVGSDQTFGAGTLHDNARVPLILSDAKVLLYSKPQLVINALILPAPSSRTDHGAVGTIPTVDVEAGVVLVDTIHLGWAMPSLLESVRLVSPSWYRQSLEPAVYSDVARSDWYIFPV
jgi:hypothetical protein